MPQDLNDPYCPASRSHTHCPTCEYSGNCCYCGDWEDDSDGVDPDWRQAA